MSKVEKAVNDPAQIYSINGSHQRPGAINLIAAALYGRGRINIIFALISGPKKQGLCAILDR
jgi:hypothetical protein